MKNLVKTFAAIAIVLAGFGIMQAQNTPSKSEEFKVYGNCGMCEARIEKAAKSVDGVESADWDKETKKIVVKYNPEKVETMEVHKAIVKVGHDTEKIEAENKVYEQLPACCKYERKKTMKNMPRHEGHQH